MHCNICDKILSESEISWNKELGTLEPCSLCLEIALDAAFSNGFSPDSEPLDDPDLNLQFGNGSVETLDPAYDNNETAYSSLSSSIGTGHSDNLGEE